MEFDCGGYTNGTSGGPFLANVHPATGLGTVIGVIGGYEQGGDTPSVSYSARFGTLGPRAVQQGRGQELSRRCQPPGGGTITSSSASSAADGIQSAAATFALTWSGERGPGDDRRAAGLRGQPADGHVEQADPVLGGPVAQRRHPVQLRLGDVPGRLASRVPGAGGWPRWTLPVSRPLASG